MSERIEKILARELNEPRSRVKTLLQKGQVTVDGVVARAGQQADPDTQEICLAGEPIACRAFVYLMLNKPTGVLSATDGKGEPTVLDLVPSALRRKGLFPAGRLDKDTTGFVLLTDDGAFAHRILSPRSHIPKTYIATLDKPVPPTAAAAFMLRKEGVNRLSIGAQSANDDILRLIGRRHNWRQVEMAVKRARKAGFRNVSLDLIYGLPSQTREDWADTLTKALALKPAHISCYGLRLEEGTPMYDEYEGTDILPSDDDQADMYLYAVDFLSRHGFRQYEISNFARPGYESRHNLKYWRLDDYIGFGAAAASNIGLLRYTYTHNVREYISGVLGDKGIIAEEEELTPFDRASEYLMLGMRTAAGISREEYRSVYQSSFDKLEEMLEVFQENGWAVCDNGRWHFTPGGFLVSNVLIGVLLESQTKEKFNANPWIREAFEAKGQKVPLPTASEPYMN